MNERLERVLQKMEKWYIIDHRVRKIISKKYRMGDYEKI